MGMTMTQKILAKHAGLDAVEAGQLIEARLDLVLGNDITTPVAITGGQEPVAEDTPVITETNGDDLKTDANTAPDGTSGNGNGAAGGDTAGAATAVLVMKKKKQ